ncbi:MAG: DNA polymerase III subunit delta [Clostridia bacterium]|nr:DNA polymerase III subunit delta [Clostridia bacterium]
MKFTELKEDLKNPAPFCYLLEGEDLFFSDRAEEMIKRRYLTEPSLNFTAFEGASLKGSKLTALVDALYALPFLSEKRFVKVTDFLPTEKEFEAYLSKLFASPVESTLLLIVNRTVGKKAGSVDWKKKEGVRLVDCSKSDELTIAKWIYLTCKRAGVAIDTATSQLLLRYCVSDMARISKETEKLIAYVGAGGTITQNTVEELVYADADFKLYEMSKAIAVKDYNRFMTIVNDLMVKGYDEMALLSTLCAYYKTLYEVSVSKGTDASVAKALGMKEYAVKKNREQAAKFSMEQLAAYYRGIYEAVTGIKTGNYTPQGAMQKVLSQIFFESM